ncbi:hypothetical protein GCM10027258_45050 [Amycolatopsis stemonae]
MTTSAWLAETVREFASLRGRRVERWSGVEMALREEVRVIGARPIAFPGPPPVGTSPAPAGAS